MKSNMYDWITGTWNPLAGECPHKCMYCSTNTLKKIYPAVREKYSGELRLDEKAMSKNLGKGKTWFVCGQNDLFADAVPKLIIDNVLYRCSLFPENTYVFQTKNPQRYLTWQSFLPPQHILGCTIESNRDFCDSDNNLISDAPPTIDRYDTMTKLQARKFATIEPILDCDPDILASWMDRIRPEFVNIGADSKNNNLPEPTKDKVHALIEKIQSYGIEVRQKSNLARLLK